MDLTWGNNENERLLDLHTYGIMDSDPEATFDQLTFLAAKACHTPISLLSFIDADRQWFKSTYGLDLEEIPRHITACNQTIRQDGIYEIKDAANNHCPYSEYMLKNGLRYYAGVPVTSKHGNNLGSLCVIDYQPRSLTKEQAKVLKVISKQVVELLELRREYERNLNELKRIEEVSFENQGHLQDVAHKAGLRAMAELSTGLIYRIRPLTSSISNAEYRIRQDGFDEDLKADLQLIQDSSERILSILASLEKFISAEKEKWMKPLEINALINNIVSHLEYRIKQFDIKLTVEMEQELRCIGNYSQLTEAIFAVLNNALEAVEQMQERRVKLVLKEENHNAVIYITDTGKGVSETIRQFIFQPLFTTKMNNSLGMGLSLAQKLIQRHNGTIELEKSYGPTTFKLSIPIP